MVGIYLFYHGSFPELKKLLQFLIPDENLGGVWSPSFGGHCLKLDGFNVIFLPKHHNLIITYQTSKITCRSGMRAKQTREFVQQMTDMFLVKAPDKINLTPCSAPGCKFTNLNFKSGDGKEKGERVEKGGGVSRPKRSRMVNGEITPL